MYGTIKKKIDELIKETDKEQIVKQLQEINDLFLTTYKLEIKYNDKTITILPVETEIYFSNCKEEKCEKQGKDKCKQCEHKIFHCGMIHNNDLQKKHFGQLYFHRAGRSDRKEALIDTTRGGVDVCISDSSNYYLSILIRSAYINEMKKENLVSGINKICKKIIKNIRKDTECIQGLLRNIEQKKDNVIVEKSEDEKIKDKNIFHQPRIEKDHYCSKSTYRLNSIDITKIDDITKQSFYTCENKKALKKIKKLPENEQQDIFNRLFKEFKDKKSKSEYLKPKKLLELLNK